MRPASISVGRRFPADARRRSGCCAARKAFTIRLAARLCCMAVIRFPARQRRRSGKWETCVGRENLRSGTVSISAGRYSFDQDSRRPVRACIVPRFSGNHWRKQKALQKQDFQRVFAPSVRYKIPVYNGRFRKNKSNQYRWFVAEKAKFTRPD